MSKLIYKFCLIFNVSVLVLLGSWSSGWSKRTSVPPPSVNRNDKVRPISKELMVDVFLDATLSMKGFVVPGTSTYYAQTLQVLEAAVVSGWPKSQVAFFKFGTRITRIARTDYLRACLPKFYDDPEFLERTFIDTVLNSANIGNLTVIVTDLFQNDADVNLLTRKLKEKFIVNDLAIGVVGIKSQFEGTVYDVGIDKLSFQYTGPRPFYVLMLGNQTDIIHYFEKLKSNGLANYQELNLAIFSQHLVDPISSFENASIESTFKIVEISGLLPPDLTDNRVKQFRIRGNPDLVSFAAKLTYFPLPHAIPFNNKALQVEVIGKQYTHDHLTASREAEQAFRVREIALLGSSLVLKVDIAPTVLPGKGIYCFEVTVHPKPESYVMPDWISEWDMDTRRIEEWRQNPSKFNGATTLNLKEFLSDLWDATVQINNPTIARLHCYFEKE